MKKKERKEEKGQNEKKNFDEKKAIDTQLIIVPTAHVSKKSVSKVREVILREQPDLIAVELCPARFRALMEGKAPTPLQLLRSPLYSSLFLLQQMLGLLFGSKPGAEMKEALVAAAELNKPILLADHDISTIMRGVATVPLKEKLGIALQLFAFPFSPLKRASLDDLTNPSFLEPILADFKSKFPATYKCLVDDRNERMFASLLNFPDRKIVLVTGAGHARGIAALASKHTQNNPAPQVAIA